MIQRYSYLKLYFILSWIGFFLFTFWVKILKKLSDLNILWKRLMKVRKFRFFCGFLCESEKRNAFIFVLTFQLELSKTSEKLDHFNAFVAIVRDFLDIKLYWIHFFEFQNVLNETMNLWLTCKRLGSTSSWSSSLMRLAWLQHFFSSTTILRRPLNEPFNSLQSSCTFFVKMSLNKKSSV